VTGFVLNLSVTRGKPFFAFKPSRRGRKALALGQMTKQRGLRGSTKESKLSAISATGMEVVIVKIALSVKITTIVSSRIKLIFGRDSKKYFCPIKNCHNETFVKPNH
jgi:hypothetical protein